MAASTEIFEPLPNDEYQIGWICALPVELTAGLVMFDQEHGVITEQDEQDTNSYHAGQIHRHNVVITCLPDGVYGTNAAATVATNMVRTFKNIKFGVLVGIGGGLPNPIAGTPGHDLRLGDVVVSSAKGQSSGVIQYDMGKKMQGQNSDSEQNTVHWFARTGVLNGPPTALRTAVANLRGVYGRGRSKIPTILQSVFSDPDLQETFGSSPPEDDRLYPTEWVHQPSTNGRLDCSSCGVEHAVARQPRPKSGPKIWYGTILSGDSVIKDSVMRDQLRDEFAKEDALCVEMEAAGLMNNFPCMVIRGICDYADSHKNDAWHTYAALTAAAFAKDLLSYVSVEQIKKERAVQLENLLGSIQAEIQSMVNHMKSRDIEIAEDKAREEQAQLEAALKECHRQLHPGTSYYEAKDVIPGRNHNTCGWVLEDDKFLSWCQINRNDLLWISADPGCGKSVLAKALVDEVLNTDKSRSICYFFFKDTTGQNSLSVALSAILHQLFTQQPALRRHARSACEQYGGQIIKEAKVLWNILMAAAADPAARPIICIVDALDESVDSSRSLLLNKLCEFYSRACLPSRDAQGNQRSTDNNIIKFLVTSRPYNTIQQAFENLSDSLPKIRLKGEDKNNELSREINLVIQQKVDEVSKRCKLSTIGKARLEEKLLSMEHRTYLWLYLALDEIERSFNHSLNPDIAELPSLPESVDDAYEKTLTKVASNAREIVRKILLIVIGARRALSTGELCLALGILSETKVKWNHMEENMRNWCGLFIFFNNGKVFLIHQTAKDFLMCHPNANTPQLSLWKQSLDMLTIQKAMSTICARAIRYDIDGSVNYLEQDPATFELQEITKSFFKYAAKFWISHVDESQAVAQDSIWNEVLALYDHFSTLKKSSWAHAMILDSLRYQHNDCAGTPIFVAIAAGHLIVLDNRIGQLGFDIEARDDKGRTPIIFAAENGIETAVRWLIEHHADVEARTNTGENALLLASRIGHSEILSMLISNGADINCGGCRSHPLLHAARLGYLECIKILISNGSSASVCGSFYGNALQCAAAFGHDEIVKVLLRNGAHVNAKGGAFGNALQAAAFAKHVSTVETLLHHGSHVNGAGGRWGTALCAAVRGTHSFSSEDELAASIKIISLLLRAGADVNSPGCVESSISMICPESYSFLLKWALAPNEWPQHDRMEIVTWYSRLTTVEQFHLLYHYANSVGDSEVGSDEMIEGFVAGPKSNDAGSSHNFLLEFLRERLTSETLPILFYREDETEMTNRLRPVQAYYTYLGSEQICDTCDILERIAKTQMVKDDKHFVQTPIPRESPEDGYVPGTPLQIACQAANLIVVKVLLDGGADPNQSDGRSLSPLQYVCLQGTFEIAQLLIDRNADVNLCGKQGSETPLELACATSKRITVDILLKAGAKLVTRDSDSNCPALLAAARAGSFEIVEELLLAGANANTEGKLQETPLGIAIGNGNSAIFESLIRFGADVNQKSEGLSPLQLARRYGERQIEAILIAAGAVAPAQEDVVRDGMSTSLTEDKSDPTLKHGHVLLEVAIETLDTESVKMALQGGANVNPAGAEQGTPLYLAASTQKVQIVGLLLAAGAVVNAQIWFSFPHLDGRTHRGTVLHAVACHGNIKAAKLLIAAGADTHSEGDLGSVAEAAERFNHIEFMLWLVELEQERLEGSIGPISIELEALAKEYQEVRDEYPKLSDAQPPGSIEEAKNRTLHKKATRVDSWQDNDFADSGSEPDWMNDDDNEEEDFGGSDLDDAQSDDDD